MAPVHPQSATALMRVIDNHLSTGARHIHLMLSSPGGSVFHGLSIYNFLRGAPIEVTTYNFGSTDSIGVVIFCAGSRRICVPHARFLIHGISTQLQAGGTYDEKGFEELLKVLNSDYRNVAGVISEATTKTVDQIVADMNTRITLNASEAKDYGLVHEIKPELFELGSSLTVIYEDCSIREVLPSAFQPPLPIPPGPVSVPIVQGTTLNESPETGTYFPESQHSLESGTIWNTEDWTRFQSPIPIRLH